VGADNLSSDKKNIVTKSKGVKTVPICKAYTGKVALDRDEWAKLLQEARAPPRAIGLMMMMNFVSSIPQSF